VDVPRRRRIVEVLDSDPTKPLPARFCHGAADILGVEGVGIAVMSEGKHLGTVCSTAPASRAEALQFDLGEGPCLDAHLLRRAVLVPDLATVNDWPAFRPAALEAGVRGAFSYPLEVGRVQLGALSLYREESGPLSPEQHDDASLLARFGVELLLSVPDARAEGEFPALRTALDVQEWEVHQATGMVAAQAGVDVEDAFAMLRGHAYAVSRPLREVAKDVVSRLVRLDVP
jgi:hypothetical protein